MPRNNGPYVVSPDEWRRDGVRVRNHLEQAASTDVWNLRKAVAEMRANEWPHWRQSEWPGFYFEYREFAMGKGEFVRGPRFGNVEFDLQSKLVWDLKVHVDGKNRVPLNDQEAVRDCISQTGFIGWMILTGSATYASDEDRQWHTDFKGGLTSYAKSNRALGKNKRRIKGTFAPESIVAFGLAGLSNLERAMEEGWIVDFKQGKNADGLPRRPKFMVKLSEIPTWALLKT